MLRMMTKTITIIDENEDLSIVDRFIEDGIKIMSETVSCEELVKIGLRSTPVHDT